MPKASRARQGSVPPVSTRGMSSEAKNEPKLMTQ
jgi:hypothetical protein